MASTTTSTTTGSRLELAHHEPADFGLEVESAVVIADDGKLVGDLGAGGVASRGVAALAGAGAPETPLAVVVMVEVVVVVVVGVGVVMLHLVVVVVMMVVLVVVVVVVTLHLQQQQEKERHQASPQKQEQQAQGPKKEKEGSTKPPPNPQPHPPTKPKSRPSVRRRPIIRGMQSPHKDARMMDISVLEASTEPCMGPVAHEWSG